MPRLKPSPRPGSLDPARLRRYLPELLQQLVPDASPQPARPVASTPVALATLRTERAR